MGRMNTSGVQQGGLAPVMGGGCNLWQLGNDGAAGNIWFIDSSHNEVGYIPTASWPSPGSECGNLPTAFSFSTNQQITQGPDGAMWFTEGGNARKIGRYANAAACNSSLVTRSIRQDHGAGRRDNRVSRTHHSSQFRRSGLARIGHEQRRLVYRRGRRRPATTFGLAVTVPPTVVASSRRKTRSPSSFRVERLGR
jgi:hypothetical protein